MVKLLALSAHPHKAHGVDSRESERSGLAPPPSPSCAAAGASQTSLQLRRIKKSSSGTPVGGSTLGLELPASTLDVPDKFVRPSPMRAKSWAGHPRPVRPPLPKSSSAPGPGFHASQVDPFAVGRTSPIGRASTPSGRASVSLSPASSRPHRWSWSRLFGSPRHKVLKRSGSASRTDGLTPSDSTALPSPSTPFPWTAPTTATTADQFEGDSYPFPPTQLTITGLTRRTRSSHSPSPSSSPPLTLHSPAALRVPVALSPIPDSSHATPDLPVLGYCASSDHSSSVGVAPVCTSSAEQAPASAATSAAEREQSARSSVIALLPALEQPHTYAHNRSHVHFARGTHSFTSTSGDDAEHSSSTGDEWPPPGLSSRFSDWTPTPSTADALSLVEPEAERRGSFSFGGGGTPSSSLDSWTTAPSPGVVTCRPVLPPPVIVDEPEPAIDDDDPTLHAGGTGRAHCQRQDAHARSLASALSLDLDLAHLHAQPCVGGVEARRSSTGEAPLRTVGAAG
ncbi:hypothetical protein JCM10449v2_006067 [Rhodotorula kratochvilovae]